MSEADPKMMEDFNVNYQLLGFPSAEEGHDALKQELQGVLGLSSVETTTYVRQRTAHIEDPNLRKRAKDFLELRIGGLKMRQEA